MKTFEIKALGLEELSPDEIISRNGGANPNWNGGQEFWYNVGTTIGEAVKDAVDWVSGLCHGLFS